MVAQPLAQETAAASGGVRHHEPSSKGDAPSRGAEGIGLEGGVQSSLDQSGLVTIKQRSQPLAIEIARLHGGIRVAGLVIRQRFVWLDAQRQGSPTKTWRCLAA